METARQFVVAGRIAAAFTRVSGVRAVALGGSLAGPFRDERSDLDLYVYADEPPALSARAAVIGAGCNVELDNRFWETGDEWEDGETGVAIDATYRSPAWVESELDRLLLRHEASTGYTTAVWHNVRTSIVLADPSGWLATTKRRADQPYPEALRRAIVAKNHPILRTAKGAYRNQIAKAMMRGDVVSVQHRVTVLLESIFDILFAVNRQTHPGEKRLLAWSEKVCEVQPPGFAAQVRALLAGSIGNGEHLWSVDALIDGVDEMLASECLLDADEFALQDLSAWRV